MLALRTIALLVLTTVIPLPSAAAAGETLHVELAYFSGLATPHPYPGCAITNRGMGVDMAPHAWFECRLSSSGIHTIVFRQRATPGGPYASECRVQVGRASLSSHGCSAEGVKRTVSPNRKTITMFASLFPPAAGGH